MLKSFVSFFPLNCFFDSLDVAFCFLFFFFTVVSYTDKRFLDLKPLSLFSFEA